jgi:hypothetical protein
MDRIAAELARTLRRSTRERRQPQWFHVEYTRYYNYKNWIAKKAAEAAGSSKSA